MDAPSTPLSESVLGILRCPISGEPFRWVDGNALEQLLAEHANASANQEEEKNIVRPMEAALVTVSNEWLYPVEDGYPILLRDRAVRLKGA